jgi:RHS repeat-associated protein
VANRLTSVLDNGVITQYAYTGDGDRVSQTVGGVATSYVFDPVGLTQVLAETTNGVSTFYVPGLAQYNVGGWQYFGQNRLGSVRTLINPTGELLLARNYDPFGNVLAQGGVGSSGFGYTGEQTDSTGLVYLRARYYQPAVGRFLTPDSTVSNPFGSQDWNRYDYVGNNPVVYVDPSGRCRGLSGAAFDACAAVVMTTAAGVHQANEYREDIFFPDADTTFADRLEASIVVGGGSVLFAAGTVEAGGAIFGGGPLTTAIGSGNIIGGGSGIAAVCANGKCESTAKLGLNSFSRAAEFGINAYNQLRPYTQGTGLQRHHLVEQRFARVLGGNPCNWPSIALTPQEHQAFTNAWRNFIVPK